MRRAIRALVLCGALFLAALAPAQADRSPLFGNAEVAVMSSEAADQVTAKGYYSDLYGQYAVENAYYAYLYSWYARYYFAANSTTSTNYYYYAHQNAYYAYLYSYYAYVYSYYGY